MLDPLEEFMNKLTDMDWGWWPVLAWRPQKNQDIDDLLLCKLSLVFGSLIGLVGWLVDIVKYSRISLGYAINIILLGWILFFLAYKFSFAIMWNRRARRLRRKNIGMS
jgi:hypothetical protein